MWSTKGEQRAPHDLLDTDCAYDVLAPAYDLLTAGYAYAPWLAAIARLARAHGLAGRRALDVACGTGKSLEALLGAGLPGAWAAMARPAWPLSPGDKLAGHADVHVDRHARAARLRQLRPRHLPRRRAQPPADGGRRRARAAGHGREPRCPTDCWRSISTRSPPTARRATGSSRTASCSCSGTAGLRGWTSPAAAPSSPWTSCAAAATASGGARAPPGATGTTRWPRSPRSSPRPASSSWRSAGSGPGGRLEPNADEARHHKALFLVRRARRERRPHALAAVDR